MTSVRGALVLRKPSTQMLTDVDNNSTLKAGVCSCSIDDSMVACLVLLEFDYCSCLDLDAFN